MKKNIFKSGGFQSLLASLLCIVLGLFLGYLVLLLINPAGAGEAILTVIKNFMTYNRPASQLKYFGNTLVKTAPLLMCALAILFAYKVGLFNIGAAGQYCAGVALSLYAALGLGWSWLPCLLVAMAGGAVLGAPLAHDFCVLSLSDRLTPWEVIERRLAAVASADFCICLYNPRSRKRADRLSRAAKIMLEWKAPDTLCGWVRNIGREGQQSGMCRLSELGEIDADMFTTVFVGNADTKRVGGRMVTPRGYREIPCER